MSVARTKTAVPAVGDEAPEFNLPSAQGGQLRLSMRTVRGPVAVVFYRPWSEEDVEYFRELAKKEDEINLALGTIVGIGVAEPEEAREFLKKTGVKSYVLYDYTRSATPEWGLLEKDKEHGEYARPATFLVGKDRRIVQSWLDTRPSPDEIFAKVHEITGLPRPPEEGEEEKPKKAPAKGREGEAAESVKPSPAERKAHREEDAKEEPEQPQGEAPKKEQGPPRGAARDGEAQEEEQG
jgi:peroxiredoxin